MSTTGRRDFLRVCGAVAVNVAVVPEILLLLPDRKLELSLDGIPTTLLPVGRESSNVAHAQYGYYNFQYQHPYAYFGQYQMWQQWNAYQYQMYMRQLALQHAWIQAYYAQMAQALQAYYSRGYMMSQPFALDSVQSVYSYGRTGNRNEILTGFNRDQDAVELEGSEVRLVSAAADLGRNKGWSRRRIERAAAPQSDASETSIDVGSSEVEGVGFETSNGLAFASRQVYRDDRSGRSGNLVVIDSDTGKEMRLVPLYN
jgi:hypothetical protein